MLLKKQELNSFQNLDQIPQIDWKQLSSGSYQQGTDPRYKLKINYDTLISYHKIYGNKWKEISNHISGTSDVLIKNMFYTLMRKAIRKLNVYIEIQLKQKLIQRRTKPFKLNFVFKLANLAESERLSQNIDSFKGIYKNLLYDLLEVGNIEISNIKNMGKQSHVNDQLKSLAANLNSLIQNLKIIEQIFIEQNLIKKGRTKKKFPKKGLIQKAYSSQAFKNGFESTYVADFQTLTHIISRKEHRETENQSVKNENQQSLYELEILNQVTDKNKHEIDNYLDEKLFDPLLFN